MHQTTARALLASRSLPAMGPVQQFLENRGCAVSQCPLPADLPARIAATQPHLVVVSEAPLLDLLDLCRATRAATQVPLLVLGQRDGEEDEVLCLEYGADNYIGPAVSPRRLQAHVAAMLRRGFAPDLSDEDAAITFGDIRVEPRRQRVSRNGQELELSHKEYALLRLLIDNPRRTVPRQVLADAVWGPGAASENRSLDVHIHWLREKLEADAGNPQHIRTVRGVGYCFEP